MVKFDINLQVETAQNVKVTQQHLELIEDCLNARFLDASFQVTHSAPELRLVEGKLEHNAITASLSDWEIQTVTELLQAKAPVRKTQPTDRVKIHRLRAKLPKPYEIKSKREGGYTLVKV